MDQEGNRCIVCTHHRATVASLPCGHVAMCKQCNERNNLYIQRAARASLWDAREEELKFRGMDTSDIDVADKIARFVKRRMKARQYSHPCAICRQHVASSVDLMFA